jgi:type 1 fimbria pilin
MKQFAISFIAIACISAMALAGGQSKEHKSSEAKSMKITGEVVDVSCYLAHGDGGKGDGHASCAQACAKNGGPLGILTKDGKLYVSVLPDDHKTGPNAILMDHVAHMVTATGVVRSKGGTNGIMITNVEMADEAKK